MMTRFNGVLTALVTPFKNGKIDLDSWKRHLERQVREGVTGFVINGTTGENPTLTPDEVITLTRVAIQYKNVCSIVLGVGGNNTARVLEACDHANELEVDAILSVTPYYNKPPSWAMNAHFKLVAERSRSPVILYNVPSRTGVDLDQDTTVELMKHPNIMGIKDASGDLSRFTHWRQFSHLQQKQLALLSGEDPLWLPSLSSGASGIISVLSNLWAQPWVDIYKAFQEGDHARSFQVFSRWLPMAEHLFSVTNPIGVKWIGAQMGFWTDECRAPLFSLSQAPPSVLQTFESRWRALQE